MLRLIIIAFALVLLAGCGMPRDPEGTLDRVTGGTLRVGVFRGNEQALAADRAIVHKLAATLHAEAVMRDGEAHTLVHQLANGELDILIGGIPSDTPFGKEVGLTRSAGPLFQPADKTRVLAVRKGENGFLLAVNRAIAQAKGARQ